jgi:hypothetical protein
MALISNGDAEDHEIKEMIEARKEAKLPPITMTLISRKIADNKAAK